MLKSPPKTKEIAPDFEISRILTGLWQVADMEKGGQALDLKQAANALQEYVHAGFHTFDMADHYGSAELIAGELLKRFAKGPGRPQALTKWCPKPGPMAAKTVRAGVQERLERLGVEQVDLLQFHWWSFAHPGWLEALHELAELREQGWIRELGVTNFDAAHLHLALADGIPLRTNQVSCSLVDRRATEALNDVCLGQGVQLLAYGTLCGGFLSERWLGQPEPLGLKDWSKMKYKRFVDAAGGWEVFQGLLRATHAIAQKHEVSVANVATRWVLDQPSVAGVIIGARLGESEHRQDNARLFEFALDQEDLLALDEAFSQTSPIPGDCGDEYRRPPFLTASGDLSHHLNEMPKALQAAAVPGRPDQQRVLSGSEWESIAGYCRAQRTGNRILVSGTTATAGLSRVVAPGDAAAQTTFILDKIASALQALGGTLEDVVRTRVYLVNPSDALAVSQAHGRVFGAIMPANTLVVVGALIGEGYLVEIEAEALLR